MKNKKFWSVAALIGLAVLFFFARRALPTTEGLFEPSYTTFSTANEGSALLYDTLKIMGFPVSRDTIFIDKDRPVDNVQVVISPDYSYTGESYYEDIADWIIRGGTLLYFDSSTGYIARLIRANTEITLIERTDSGILYGLGLGKLFIGDVDYITNEGLINGGDVYAQQIANMLINMDYGKIYFNEAYHGYGTEKSLFESLPIGVRLLAWQLVFLTIAVIIYFGKRFGRVVPYYEEIEREENEYVFTLTNLYMSIGLGSAAVDVYDKKFKKACGNYFRNSEALEFKNILALWQAENIPGLNKLDYIANSQLTKLNTKRPSERKEFMKIISYYKELIYIVSKL